MKILVFGVTFLCFFNLIGQTIKEPPHSSNSSVNELYISGHAYPVSAIGEVHKSFTIQYGISRSIQLELQGFYDTYLLTERFRTNFVSKFYLNHKLYLFTGMEVEVATEDAGKAPVPYRLGFVAGAGYDVSENFMLEVRSNVQLNNASIGAFGETKLQMPAVYTIGSKWKF